MGSGEAEGRGVERRVRQHVLAREHRYFAVVQPGLEETALREVAGLGVAILPGSVTGGFFFGGKLDTCYRVNLCARTVTRVLMRVGSFIATGEGGLVEKTAGIPWELFLPPGTVPAVSVTARKSKLHHTGRIGAAVRDAVAGRSGTTPGAGHGGQTIHCRIYRDRCTLSLDTSGEPLYRRGYKQLVTGAPLRETLAAAILASSGIFRFTTVIDPFCGSGTFSLEAAGMLSGRPPGRDRRFAFMGWPAYSAPAFRYLTRELAVSPVPAAAPRILASDIDPAAVEVAETNTVTAGFSGVVSVSQSDFFTADPPAPAPGESLVVINPPYGKRLPAAGSRLVHDITGRLATAYYGAAWSMVIPSALLAEPGLAASLEVLALRRVLEFRHGGIPVTVLFRSSPLGR